MAKRRQFAAASNVRVAKEALKVSKNDCRA